MADRDEPDEVDDAWTELEVDDEESDSGWTKDVLTDFGRRLDMAKIEYDARAQQDVLIVEWPNGRRSRKLRLRPSKLLDTHDIPVEDIKFLGRYQAIWNIKSGVIEARVSGYGLLNLLKQVPDAEMLSESGDWTPFGEENAPASAMRDRIPWRIRVAWNEVSIEIGSLSRDLQFFTSAGVSNKGTGLRIQGASPGGHDEALALLEDLGNSFLFDLDARYGAMLKLSDEPHGPREIRRERERISQGPAFPMNRYATEAVTLYQYGRSALGLPLLQFLAFYQVLEFFIPTFSSREGILQLRNRIKNPAFDLNNDVSMASLLRGLTTARPGAERDQLRIAVRQSTEVGPLREYIESSDRRKEHFCSNKQAIKGVQKIDLGSGANDLRDQVADRIYAIRCRIVHTKQDGGHTGVEMLLPASDEERSLRDDVELVQLVAQSATVAAASRRS